MQLDDGQVAAVSAPPLLRLAGLCCGGVDGLDLEVPGQSLYVLVGHSAAALTAVMRAVAGLDAVRAGSVAVGGRAGAGTVGFVLREPTLFPWLTLRQNLWVPLKVGGWHGADPWRVDALLAVAGLLEVADRLPIDLPAPVRRLGELCRALVRNPSLVLLDEPFDGMGSAERARLADSLARLRAACRASFVLFTTDAWSAVRAADRLGVLAGTPTRLVGQMALPRPGGDPAAAMRQVTTLLEVAA